MTMHIDIAEVSPALVNDLANNGGEITLTRDGKPIAKLVRVESAPDEPSEQPRSDGKVLYKGRWMIPAAADRERSIEHLRGRVKILGDIVSPIDDVEYDALK
jgi:antitoxin (DNA-binding transcriptional repressor) of toxin-antitoxin stability system